MCRIPHARRRNGRYVFRRRVHFRKIISKPLAIALQTADPAVARQRAALLSARFAVVKLSVDKMIECGRPLNAAEIEALFREELERELSAQLHEGYKDGEWSASVPGIAALDAEGYRLLALPNRTGGLTDADRVSLRQRGLEGGIWIIEELIDQAREFLTDERIEQKLHAIGAPVHAENIATARKHLIRARAQACLRAERLFDQDVLAAPNPVHALTQDLGEPSVEASRLLGRETKKAGPLSHAQSVPESPFLIYENRRFGDVIEEIIAELKSEGTWNGDLKQQRRIMRAFAWITGNRELGSYNHLDVSAFKNGLKLLPTSFRYGTPTKGAMSRPFKQVVAELPPLQPDDRRDNKTINRDLSTMSTVAKHLAQTAWKPKVANTKVMDFAEAMIAIKESDSTDLRPPWTTAHLKCLFDSPLYRGGGGAKHRLKDGEPLPTVWHDAAYFAPLLWYYSHACREEICGLELADVTTDHAVPHFEIKDNLTRGRNGEKAGEKRPARHRIPADPPRTHPIGLSRLR